MTELEKRLITLPAPTIVQINDFETHLAENIILVKEVLGKDWSPLESDPYMKKLRILTLRQLHNRADKNETIKQLLITTATGVNLEHLGLEKDVMRDLGEKPRALSKFFLSRDMPFNIVIPKGTVINNTQLANVGDVYTAVVVEDVVVLKGDTEVTVSVELDAYIEQSDVKCEKIVTTIPYVAGVEQLSRFENGFPLESDDRYRYRIIKSNAKYSTAGCVDAYEYYTRLADSRIDDVVISASEGVVSIVVHSFSSADTAMLERINKSVNAKRVRPISDNPIAKLAEVVEITLNLTIEIYDMTEQAMTKAQIEANFEKSFFIGQDLVLSDVLRKCHLENVYRVNTSFTDVIASKEQVIKITQINFFFMEVLG